MRRKERKEERKKERKKSCEAGYTPVFGDELGWAGLGWAGLG